jgi:serine/threonine protein kinase/Tol biopolymer transport system component
MTMTHGDSFFGVGSDRVDRLVARALDDSEAEEPTGSPTSLDMVLEGVGSRIDRYKLFQVLGEGGMGIVYLAEQCEPVRREVALKIIKPGMDSKRVLARFEAEQQTLAMMEHLHIARVYDAGLAPSGRPYFVMEYVKGLAITEYCDKHHLTVEQRLGLFLHVCEAIQHAHQKGIIHRDIKPSNILVVDQDHEMIPKVIDFGVARAISQPLTERTLYTEQGQLIGTPEYMSPEQADLSNRDIDTRTDVYSLGLVVYELLAGVWPFDPEPFRAGGIDQIRRVICEEDPKTPSTRLSKTSAAESSEVARRRRTDARTLRRKLQGDLDWITLKALEKDRTRRYATVDAMATDIRNYLRHLPVSAAPPGRLYRARKFARRHRQAMAVTGAVLLLLLVSLWAIQSRVQADRESTRAQESREELILAKARDLFDSRDVQPRTKSDPSSDALAMLKPILVSGHVGPQARFLYASILAEYRYYDEALPVLEKLLNERSEIAGAAYGLLARILWEGPSLGPAELGKVEEYKQKAEELCPKTADAYYLRAMTAFTIHQKRELLDKALELDTRHYPSLRLRALTFLASRQYKRLRDEALLMMHERPGDPLGYSLRAAALKELGDYKEAVTCYDQAINKLTSPEDPQYIELNGRRCAVLMQMRQYDRVLADSEACLKRVPSATILHFHEFCALTALGQYAQANALFHRVADGDPAAHANLRDWSMKYVFDVLEADQTWHPSDNEPQGASFLPMLEAEETHRNLSRKARPLIPDGFGMRMKPDGTKVVFSAGVHGYSGVAVYDLTSQETDLLIVPGLDPRWSPDGQHIAFVRGGEVLRLSELTAIERRRSYSGARAGSIAEVWVMQADGTKPRRVARGAYWPSWEDAEHLYYFSRVDNMLYSISIEDAQSQPIPVFASYTYPSVSPDGNYVAAMANDHTLRITDLTSGSCVGEWTAPLATPWGGEWSPDSQEFSLGGMNRAEDRTGLWIYGRETGEAAKVLSGQIVGAAWSWDKRLLLAYVGPPYYEIWAADLDPGVTTVESLGPAQTMEEHCRESIAVSNRTLEFDPNDFASHWTRTVSALWIHDEQASTYLRELDRTAERVPMDTGTCYVRARWILANPTLHDPLFELALILARETAERDVGYAKDLAHILYRTGQREHAIRLWPRAEAAMPHGNCQYDEASDTYTITGAGWDIGGTIDDLRFTYKELAGNGSITARIDGVENVDPWTKAGLMVRSTLEPDCLNVMLCVTPSGILSFQHRTTDCGGSVSANTPSNSCQLPQWLRLTREGNHFTALHSSDGVTWADVLLGSDQRTTLRISMRETVYVGLAVTSHDITRTAEARISHVTTTGNVSPRHPLPVAVVSRPSEPKVETLAMRTTNEGRGRRLGYPPALLQAYLSRLKGETKGSGTFASRIGGYRVRAVRRSADP